MLGKNAKGLNKSDRQNWNAKDYVPSLNEVLKKADNWNARNKLHVATAKTRTNSPHQPTLYNIHVQFYA